MKKYYLKEDVDFERLKEYGYFISHVAVFPKKIVKQVDNSHVIEIGIEEPSRNIWTGIDWKDSRLLCLYHCKKIESNCKRTILIEPNVKEHLYYENDFGTYNIDEIKPYIQDLIKANLVEERDN